MRSQIAQIEHQRSQLPENGLELLQLVHYGIGSWESGSALA